MLILSSYKTLGIHEHVFRTREGVLMRVTFEVKEIDGRLRGRIIATERVFEVTGDCASKSCLALSGSTVCTNAAESRINTESVVSPYLNFDFFISQMTRAPAR